MPAKRTTQHPDTLKLRRVAIDTYRENVAYLHRECVIYRAEGFQTLSKIEINANGNTVLAVATQQIKASAAAAVHCLITHAIFAEGTEETLIRAGVENIWSTDSITHPTNAICLTGLLADALRPGK